METRRNYDAVNAAVAIEQQKIHEALRFRKATVMELYGNSVIKFAASLSIIILAAGVVWWLLHDESDTIIRNTYNTIDPNVAAALENLNTKQMPADSSGTEVKQKFTVFHTVDRGNAQIVTGWNYYPDNLDKPYEQYCYWAIGTSGGFESSVVYLGRIDESKELTWHSVSDEYSQYSKDCQFNFKL